MVYQRRIPADELFSAQLEMLMQSGRIATVSMHLVGVLAAILMFWPFLSLNTILLWAAGFLIFLLLRSLLMSNALVERSYDSHPRRVYWQLLIGTGLTGAVWAAVYIYAANHVPVSMQYIFLLLIVMISAFSLGFSVALRDYYIVYIFASLWPIAWWSLAHYRDQAHNLVIGLALLAFCALLIYVCNQTYLSFRNMIALTWERETIAKELNAMAGSLKDRNLQLQDARRKLTELANIDELTGLGNRRLVNRVLREEMNRARRSGSQMSLIMLDVDHFKNYNDSYGHVAGDEVLQRLADIMQRTSTRAGEVVARFGGEEFVLLLPGASADAALRSAQRLREMVARERIPHESSGVAAYLTVSQGVVTVTPDGGQEPADLVRRADNALYKAKKAGRDTIAIG